LTIFHDEAISYEGCTGFRTGERSFVIRLRGKIMPNANICLD